MDDKVSTSDIELQKRQGPSPSNSQITFPQFRQFPIRGCSVARHVQN